MNLLEYPRISEGDYQINSASYVSENDVEFIGVNSVLQNIPFDSPYDNVEVSAFDTATGELLKWGCLTASINESTQNSSYTKLTGEYVEYEYTKMSANFPVVKTNTGESSILLDPIQDINTLELPNSAYTLVYSMLSNIAGETDNKFRVLKVSSDRTELHAVLEDSTDSNSLLRLKSFNDDIPFVSRIAQPILNNITSVKFSNVYFDTREDNTKVVETLLHTYGFKVDVNFLNFLSDVYSGYANDQENTIEYQFKHYLYSNFNDVLSYDTLYNTYSDIVDYVVRFQLDRITTFAVHNKEEIIHFIKSIYLSVYDDTIDELKVQLSVETDNTLKTFVNFGNNNLIMILNHKSGEVGEVFIKLRDPLPEGEVGKFYISRLVTNPIVLKTSLYSVVEAGLTDLKTANFNIDGFSSPTKNVSSEEIVKSDDATRSELSKKKFNIDIDYTEYANFVAFSSAEIRLNNYIYKYDTIQKLTNQITTLQSENFDTYRSKQISELADEINLLIESFDGYERFLYENPDYVGIHSNVSDGGLSVAQEYDRFNTHSLRNNLAEYIRNDAENFEFLKFIDMVGQAFDEIFNYVNSFTRNKRVEHLKTEGASDSIVNSMLSMLGWDNSGVDDSELLLNLYGENEHGDVIEKITPKSRKDIVWRRLLNNLPYILKTKGTEECIRVLFNTYGIPHSLYSINEYSSIPAPSTVDAFYTFDNDYYALHYSGSNEYIKTDWDSDAQSIEFKVSFDVEKLHPEGSVFRLVGLDNSWVIGAIRDGSDSKLGKLFFTLASIPGDPSSIKTVVTENIPLFSGELYSVLLRRNDIADDVILPTNYQCGDTNIPLEVINSIPARYDIVAKRSVDSRMIVETSGSAYFDEDYNTSFSSDSGSNLYIGNFTQLPSDITPDPDAFYGTIDQFKIYTSAVTDSRFDSHVFYVDAYDVDDYTSLSNDLVLHLKFNSPVDLYSLSGSVALENNSISDSKLSNISAHNFPAVISEVVDTCPEDDCCKQEPQDVIDYISKFPWQFKKFQTIESIKIPSFGASTYKNNKILYDTTTYSGSLYTDVTSFLTDDLSIDVGSPSLGVFFSATEEENKEILRFFGDFNIGDFIGNPTLVYQKQYHEFNRFKRHFYDTYNKIDFNDYMNLIRHYVDKSIYKNLETIIPARTKLKTGLLVESSILDRNKLEYKPITVNAQSHEATVDSSLDITATPVFLEIEAAEQNTVGLIKSKNSSMASKTQAQNLNDGVVLENADPVLFTLFSYDGYVTHKGKRYIPEMVTRVEPLSRFVDHNVSGSSEWREFPTEIERLNLIPVPDDKASPQSYYLNDVKLPSSEKSRVLNGYHKTHRIHQLKFYKGASTQTTDTTVSEGDNLLSGDLPFESFEVDRGTINVSTESDGVVLEGKY